jgi:hypothetical protein
LADNLFVTVVWGTIATATTFGATTATAAATATATAAAAATTATATGTIGACVFGPLGSGSRGAPGHVISFAVSIRRSALGIT